VLVEQPLLLGESNLATLRDANQVVVIATGLELVTLRETKGLLAAIADRVVPRDRLRVIVNRWEPRGFISEADVERTLGFPVWAYLPNDERLVLHSINVGSPVVLERPTAPLSLQLKGLARRLAGLPAEATEARRRFAFRS
jgi:Flp pilus assembly CpaE family ATPase